MIEYTREIVFKIFNDPMVAAFLTMFGILLSVWGIYRALRGRRLSYRRIDISFPRGKFEDNKWLQNKEDGESGKASAEIAVWNSGRKYINSSDMARKEPLRIVAKDEANIIAGEVLFTSCDSSDINCIMRQDHKEMLIDFDYLECGEGCVINIIYEGQKKDVEIQGVIKGQNQIKESQSIMQIFKRNRLIYNILTSKISSWIIIFFCLFMCPIAYLQSGNFWAIENNFFGIPDTPGGRLCDLVLIITLIIFSLGVSIPFWIRLFTPRFPKGLEEHFGK